MHSLRGINLKLPLLAVTNEDEFANLCFSVQDLETKFKEDCARNPLSIGQQQFRELLDAYIDRAWALDRVSHKRPRPSNDDIAKSIWTIIERM